MKYWDGYDRPFQQFDKYQNRTVNIKQFLLQRYQFFSADLQLNAVLTIESSFDIQIKIKPYNCILKIICRQRDPHICKIFFLFRSKLFSTTLPP